ncbi:MAG: alpha-amylase [Propionibacteriaceae bacterium]|jgi:glycosidase|nr:alpha-amylase [Propionibacteriaceae bacterium]
MTAWQIYPLGFCGAPKFAGDETGIQHRLTKIDAWLDYAADLGFDAIALNPIFASVSHGYDTVDYYRIDPRLGDQGDFEDLAQAVHGHGMKLYLDGVFNHVSASHPLFLKAVQDGQGSEAGQMFRWFGDQPYLFEGSEGMVTLNHSSQAVAALVVDVMKHWLGLGADGWRLDAAYAVPADFWSRVLPSVRAGFPGVYIWGEQLHGDYAAFVEKSGANSATQYELWKAIWSSIKSKNFWELSWALKRHQHFLQTFSPVTFVGNHDVTRVATQVGEDGAVLALAVLMTVGGSPHIYYGDEQGYTGTKYERAGGDDEIRPPYPDTPDQMSALGAKVYQAHKDLIAMRNARPWLDRALTTENKLMNEHYSYTTRGDGVSLTTTLNVQNDGHPWVEVRDERGTVVYAYHA